MFTGIVEATGTVLEMRPVETGARLVVEVPFASELEIGESVAVNGCCLTAVELTASTVAFDLLHETMKVTALGDLVANSQVNLERALPANGRLSGHFVQGHVDAVGEILAWEAVGQDHRFEVSLPADFARYVIQKGSICVDGISLTVAELGETSFTLWIIPHTAEVTRLGKEAAAGKRVNLEFDVLAKYVERFAQFA